VVQDGPQKGKEILKEEKDMGFVLLHFSNDELKKAIIDKTAPRNYYAHNRKALNIRKEFYSK
jgi:hypothetical protein